ncbi:hypothetical protein [Anaerotruncus rubiinfantis]|uniref:hypothetical protein n=1 Tax=Anaerotruncus rubiinfantis TaxID=1720200 RepID=UPI0008355EC6|nr:hypothetical protein [Anaerotruncus rubiinfantis]RGX52914.1 hypothetical protein DWV16_17545 [Anaerotruncus sp. AF02-27]
MFWKSLRTQNERLKAAGKALAEKYKTLEKENDELTAKARSLEGNLNSLKNVVKVCKEQKFCEVCKFGARRKWNVYIPFGGMHECSEMICLKNVSCEDFEKQET